MINLDNAKLGSVSVARAVDRKEIEIAGERFVMVATSRWVNGPLGWIERPNRIELYRVDPADGIEMFVGFLGSDNRCSRES